MSADYVAMLAARMPGWDFVNAGANAELAYNLAGRLGDIVALRPEAVTILIGTNDVNATFGFQAALGYMAAKRLPERPSPYFFRENLVGIVRTLKRETEARVALFSIPPIGEEPGHYAYLRTEDYSLIIRGVAEEEGVEYLPLRERICAYLESLPREASAAGLPRVRGRAAARGADAALLGQKPGRDLRHESLPYIGGRRSPQHPRGGSGRGSRRILLPGFGRGRAVDMRRRLPPIMTP